MERDDELHFVVDTANAEASDAETIDEDFFGWDSEAEADTEAFGDIIEEERFAEAKECLQGGKPLFLIQRSHQHAALIPAALNHINTAHNSSLNLGVVAPIPRMRPSGASGIPTFFRNTEIAPVQIADPECFARPDSYGAVLADQRDGKPFAGPSTSTKWPYFHRNLSSGWTADWVADVIRVQREQGATVFLTPGLWLNPADRAESLRVLRDCVSWARAETRDYENLAVNVTIPYTWLTTERLRDSLLAELLDMDEEVFYVRVRWPLLAQPYGQLASPEILDGYVELASVCEENDKFLILPNTALTGWAALAWGASGFSTGIGSGERAFADTKVIKIKRTTPRPAPTNRTFRRSLLHVVDVDTDSRLSALPGQSVCGCEFCRAQTPGLWDKARAGAHYLATVADAVAEASDYSRGRRAGTRAIARGARDFRDSASAIVPLSGANDPKHLDLWLDRLS
ncbi:hypothetical protein [Streptomyces sp. NBC_01306]|uniref:hypothetical protein n=1 Tax=Streptomyces sp. NBC_01306 TaxID=2903819 RepID=UPI00225AD305|nr:hypothetical protein [Streptomyces sp. NBC_01306]MCX4726974.1 hypothetical protein [Streptomyces sp. NBC_01306]